MARKGNMGNTGDFTRRNLETAKSIVAHQRHALRMIVRPDEAVLPRQRLQERQIILLWRVILQGRIKEIRSVWHRRPRHNEAMGAREC